MSAAAIPKPLPAVRPYILRSIAGFVLLCSSLTGSTVLAAAEPATGLADSAALRATVFGTPPQDIAPLPSTVPLEEIEISVPWRRPVPALYWFDARLRAWLSAQRKPAPLVIVVAGTGGDGNDSKIATLRAVLYGAGYHVLTLPSPTFPGFIVSASRTGVAGDLTQDSQDLYDATRQIVAHLPDRVHITEVDVVGYSLGAANAGVMKSIDAREHKLGIHRAVLIEPPVALFVAMSRLDRLYRQSIGSSPAGLENLYRRLYTRLANLYRAKDTVHINASDLLTAASSVLRTDADYSAAIALTFRLALVDVFLAGDLYARTGVVVDPRHPPGPEDSLERIGVTLRAKTFDDYFNEVFAPYYLQHRPTATLASLRAGANLAIIGEALHQNGDYYAQTNRDDLILDQAELAWLERQFGPRIAVYAYGGHLGNLGDRRQVADMLAMLAGQWQHPRP